MSESTEIQYSDMSYDQFLMDVETIARGVEADQWKPDYIVGIGRGGLVPGTFLSHRLSIPLLSIDHSSKVHAFSEALLTHLSLCIKQGERYLFVDDINDSGKTLARFKSSLCDGEKNHDNLRFCVLINNVNSRETVEYSSRTIDRRTDKRWFIFPWGAVASKAAREQDAREDPERLGLKQTPN
jgi:hypoxanthine phosphoribosyltransferase